MHGAPSPVVLGRACGESCRVEVTTDGRILLPSRLGYAMDGHSGSVQAATLAPAGHTYEAIARSRACWTRPPTCVGGCAPMGITGWSSPSPESPREPVTS